MRKKHLIIIIFFGVTLSLLGILYATTKEPVVYKNNSHIEKSEVEAILPKKTIDEYHINKYFDLVPNSDTSNKKVVLMTIDDGPTKRAPEIMRILESHNIKAIFFINGIHNKDAPGVIKEIYDRGFTLGNHGWSHDNLRNEKNNDTIIKEIDSNSDLIKKITGTAPKFFRPPYGMSNSYVRDFVQKENMIFMNWSGAVKDWEKSAREEKVFISNVMDTLHSGEIILMHEHPWTVEYLDALLVAIKNEGYIFIDPSQVTDKYE